MAAKRSKPVASKANEPMVAGIIAKIFGCYGTWDTIRDVMTDVHDRCDVSFARDVDGLYPWLVDVAGQVMSGKGDLIDHLVALTEPVLVVKDTQRSGADAVWLVSAFAPDRLATLDYDRFRGLFNHVQIGEEVIKITAVQLNSCRMK